MSRRKLLIEVFVVVLILAVLAGVLAPQVIRARDESQKFRCASMLRATSTCINMYLTGIGNNVWYPQPAKVFYGDTWLLTLYWEGIIKDTRLFWCPATNDDCTKIEKLVPKKYDAVIPVDAVSYAGRCCGLTGNVWRNTTNFAESALAHASVFACDDNQGKPNHPGGLNVCFFDSYVVFIPNQPYVSAYMQVGAQGTTWCKGELEKMDSGGGE